MNYHDLLQETVTFKKKQTYLIIFKKSKQLNIYVKYSVFVNVANYFYF